MIKLAKMPTDDLASVLRATAPSFVFLQVFVFLSCLIVTCAAHFSHNLLLTVFY